MREGFVKVKLGCFICYYFYIHRNSFTKSMTRPNDVTMLLHHVTSDCESDKFVGVSLSLPAHSSRTLERQVAKVEAT